MLHVGRIADKFLKDLKKKGNFEGIKVLRIERECTWTCRYALFIIEFDDICDFENPYVSFDWHGFNKDFMELLQKTFPECDIRLNKHTREYEIIAPGYMEHYEKFKDRLEEVAEKGGWSIFEDKPGASG